MTECQPVEIKKMTIESDHAFQKLLEIGIMIKPKDYGGAHYVSKPEVARGQRRIDLNRMKEAYT